MPEKTSRLSMYAHQVGLSISLKKTEVMTLNTSNPDPVKADREDLPTTEQFIYLGSIIRQDGGAGNDIQSRINNVRNIFWMLNNVWRSTQCSTHSSSNYTKLYCVLLTLLYGSECLVNARERPDEVVYLPHQKPTNNTSNLLAPDHLQQRPACVMQPGEHGYHHHAKTLEVDR